MLLCRVFFVGSYALICCACSSLTDTSGQRAPVAERVNETSAVPAVPPRGVHKPVSPPAGAAWRPLLAEAEQCTGRGDYERALALLERAQRIDPDSAEIYLGMARTHAARGDTSQAHAVAARGLLYCTSVNLCDALRPFTR
ncbi:MAG: tetratricopeptide repeat protein [Halioglobus sp.]|nr:tetratricopeptide repeat protein [Halioglobus sp.]